MRKKRISLTSKEQLKKVLLLHSSVKRTEVDRPLVANKSSS